jgi:hypothetical protein
MSESKGSPKDAESSAARRGASKSAKDGDTEQLVLTLSVATGEIVKVEKIDPSGQRHELTDDEFAELAIDDVTDELEAALEDAYETGVVDALGEDAEELSLRPTAVSRLLVRGMLRNELGRHILRRAIRRQILKREMQRRTARR